MACTTVLLFHHLAASTLWHLLNCLKHISNTTTAHWQISVGMGTLAGSTVMLLTIVWGGSVLCGRCDLDEASGMQRDKRRTRPWWDLMATGAADARSDV